MNPDDPDNGVQSLIGYRFSLIPPFGITSVAMTMAEGERKGYKNQGWQVLGIDTHLDHAMGHIMAHMMGDRKENHLSHAACRILMALDTYERECNGFNADRD